MSAVLELDGLTKDYAVGFWVKRPVRALDTLTLSVEEGEIFGFLGPNGAGKTTTLKLLMRIIHPTSGTARILGQPLGHPEIYRQVGYLPEQPYFYDYLTPKELLSYFGQLFGLDSASIRERVPQLLQMVGLADESDVQLRKFSKGMLQRIGVAQAILNAPKILFLDEPFSGLDPIGRRELRDIVRRLNAQGVTIFFSSHVLSDVESLCSRFAILYRGKLLESGQLEEALNREGLDLEVIAANVAPETTSELRPHVREIAILGDRVKLTVSRDGGIAGLVKAIEEAGGRIVSVSAVRPSLEDLFVSEIGRRSSQSQEAAPVNTAEGAGNHP